MNRIFNFCFSKINQTSLTTKSFNFIIFSILNFKNNSLIEIRIFFNNFTNFIKVKVNWFRIKNFLARLIPNISPTLIFAKWFFLANFKFWNSFLKFHIPFCTVTITRNFKNIRGTASCSRTRSIQATTFSAISIFIKLGTRMVFSKKINHNFF